jgi:hypothetical protein
MSCVVNQVMNLGEKCLSTSETTCLALELLLQANPELRTDAMAGQIHNQRTNIEFDRDRLQTITAQLAKVQGALDKVYPPQPAPPPPPPPA